MFGKCVWVRNITRHWSNFIYLWNRIEETINCIERRQMIGFLIVNRFYEPIQIALFCKRPRTPFLEFNYLRCLNMTAKENIRTCQVNHASRTARIHSLSEVWRERWDSLSFQKFQNVVQDKTTAAGLTIFFLRFRSWLDEVVDRYFRKISELLIERDCGMSRPLAIDQFWYTGCPAPSVLSFQLSGILRNKYHYLIIQSQ
jgi:hypothetical protein